MSAQNSNTNNAQQLIHTAGELFRKKGYHNTSISDIASHCGLSKASVYHHVTSKKELVMATIKQIHQHFTDQIFAIAYNETLPKSERLIQLTFAVENFFIKREGGSLVGNLSLELSGSDEQLDRLIQAYFSDWIAAVEHVLKDGNNDAIASEIHALAEDIVSLTQGAIMLASVYKSPAPLERVKKRVFELKEKTCISA